MLGEAELMTVIAPDEETVNTFTTGLRGKLITPAITFALPLRLCVFALKTATPRGLTCCGPLLAAANRSSLHLQQAKPRIVIREHTQVNRLKTFPVTFSRR